MCRYQHDVYSDTEVHLASILQWCRVLPSPEKEDGIHQQSGRMSIPTTIRNRKQARLGCRKACSRAVECHLQHTPRGPHKHSSIQPVHETRLQVCIQTRRIDCILWRSTTRHTSCSHGQKTPRVIIIIDLLLLLLNSTSSLFLCFCFVCLCNKTTKQTTNKQRTTTTFVRKEELSLCNPTLPTDILLVFYIQIHVEVRTQDRLGSFWHDDDDDDNDSLPTRTTTYNIQRTTTRKGSDWNSQGCSFVTR